MTYQDTPKAGLTRRGFMIAAGATGAISMGYGLLPTAGHAAGHGGMISPSMFFDIHSDGAVTVHVAKAEMGQHVGTALAQVLAEELDCGWENVNIKYVGFDPRHGLHITGGSWSVNWTFDALSRAGAAGKIALLEAAAAKLGGTAADYTVADGVVTGSGGKVTYGELAADGIEARQLSEDEMKALVLKAPADRNLVGKPVAALDIPDKVRGKAMYGMDASLPGMVYAVPVAAPVRYGASVTAVDDTAAKSIPGYEQHVIVTDPLGTQTGFVMAIANSYWAAKQAGDALKITYDLGPNASTTLADIHAENDRLIESGEGSRLVLNDGDTDAAMGSAEDSLEATYSTGMNIHAPLEPMNCTVEIKDGVYDIHAGNQFQTLLMGLIGALGVAPENIRFHQYLIGGGFGRRLDCDYVVQACLTAQAIGKPVKMIYSRETDMQVDFTRPAATIKMEAGLKGGKIDAWRSTSASAWASARQAPAFLAPDLSGDEEKKYDGFAVNGADHWYSMPNQKVLLSMNEVAQAALPPGHLRSVGPGWQFFAVESFIDELAAKTGTDPLEMRLSLLDGAGKNAGGAERLKNVLSQVAERAGYGTAQAAGTAIGISAVSAQERASASWTACAANVTVNADGTFKVNKLTVASDVGTVVNPNGVLAQLTGSTMWGLSIATLEEGVFEEGAIQHLNFDSYTPARMTDLPEIDAFLVPSDNYPTGCGEPGTTSVAPAIANAIAAATGARVRSLPITAAKVKAAM